MMIPSAIRPSRRYGTTPSRWLGCGTRFFLPILIILAGLMGPGGGPAWGQTPLALTSDGESWNLGPHVEIFKDDSGALDFEKVSRNNPEIFWRPGGKPLLWLPDSSSAYWIRFRLIHPPEKPIGGHGLVLHILRPTLEHVDLFIPAPSADGQGVRYERLRGGTAVEPAERNTLAIRSWAFEIPPTFAERAPFYLRLQSRFSMNCLAELWTEEAFSRSSTQDSYLYGLLYGLLAAMILYNLFLYLSLKDRMYLFYVLTVFFVLAFQATVKGHLRLLFGLGHAWHQAMWWILAGGVVFWGFTFARIFLVTRSNAPRWDRLLWGFSLLGPVIVLTGLAGWEPQANLLSMLTGLVMPLSNIGAGVVVWARGYRPARFYLLAFSLLAVFVYIYVFQGLGLIPATRFTNMSMTLGAALEALFLAFALADRIRHLQQEKDAAKERETLFKSLSQTDPLTGLFNQRVLTERLAAELDQARIHHGPLSVIMMDLDHFKDYNDRYGHPEGDQVLKALAGVIRTSIRDTDCPCRYGGEEFTVILPGTRAEHAAAVAERIRRSLADQVFEPTPGREEHVTVSLGVTEHRPDDTAPNLIARADQALYQAKTDGRNRTSRV